MSEALSISSASRKVKEFIENLNTRGLEVRWFSRELRLRMRELNPEPIVQPYVSFNVSKEEMFKKALDVVSKSYEDKLILALESAKTSEDKELKLKASLYEVKYKNEGEPIVNLGAREIYNLDVLEFLNEK